jgi:cysteinyl-tRNA synthetase
MQEWVERLEDDFDTLSAMTLVYEYQTYINTGIDDEIFSLGEIDSLIGLLKSWNEVIAILDFDILDHIESIPNEITVLLIDRNEAKMRKNYAEADRIRDELDRLGYRIIDEKNGSRVEKK